MSNSIADKLACHPAFMTMVQLIEEVDRIERRCELFGDIFKDLFAAWNSVGDCPDTDEIARRFTHAVIKCRLFERIAQAAHDTEVSP